MKKFIETYGNKKAKEVFYASKNKGCGALGVAPMSAKKKKKRELKAQANSDKDLEL